MSSATIRTAEHRSIESCKHTAAAGASLAPAAACISGKAMSVDQGIAMESRPLFHKPDDERSIV